MMRYGFARMGCAAPRVTVLDPLKNAESMLALAKEAAERGASLLCFPELSLVSSTGGDLVHSPTLQKGALEGLKLLLDGTQALDLLLIVGLPIAYKNSLINCAAVLQKGRILGLVPKQSSLPADTVDLLSQKVPMSCDLLFACETMPEFILGVDLSSETFSLSQPAERLCTLGATVIAAPAASAALVGRAERRRQLFAARSAMFACACLYAGAGLNESTQDLVFAGHSLICENGHLLAESKPFASGLTLADVDLSRLITQRRRLPEYPALCGGQIVSFSLPVRQMSLQRKVSATPFVPEDENKRAARCAQILEMQSQALAARLCHIGSKCAVLGLSGGLDSTLALIVTCHAFDLLGLERKGILAVTMPCFGTTGRTRSNAELLARAYGTDFMEVSILDSVRQHFKDIGQSEEDRSVTYENAQARERTQVLMDLANQRSGLVVGTGDLSELALGWATYNGDHMSMYGVNASVPKTLVRHLVAFEAGRSDAALAACLRDILSTPVSPELLPPKDGDIAQKTEDIVGPYELHDFFLYYFVRHFMEPKKIEYLALQAFAGKYDRATIRRWLRTFLSRFFSQAFKRSCLPDGPAVGSVSLSPRGDWRMPSDATARLWLKELED